MGHPTPADGESPHRLTAAGIRTTHFPTTRHGYQPKAVHELLDQIADEILRLHNRLADAYAENDRIKRSLRQWQTNHATTCQRPDSRANPVTRRDWPTNS